MNTKQKVWYISAVILLVCVLIALLVYKFTGVIFFAIFFAPPVIHYILKKRWRDEQQEIEF